MAAAPEPRLITAEELMQLPDDGNCYELDEGRLICMPPGGMRSSRVTIKLSTRLNTFVEAHDLGFCTDAQGGVLLFRGPDTVRAPDIAFISKERAALAGTGYFPGAPDLAVEVLSPSDRPSRVSRKVQQYLAAGARLVWVIDPEDRTAAVYRPGREMTLLEADGVLDGEDVLPGFRLPLADIWVD